MKQVSFTLLSLGRWFRIGFDRGYVAGYEEFICFRFYVGGFRRNIFVRAIKAIDGD